MEITWANRDFHTSHTINYMICTSVDGSARCFGQPIKDGKMFTYKRYVRPTESEETEVTIVVYPEAEPEPIENVTYHVGPRR